MASASADTLRLVSARLFGATNKVLNLNKYHEVQYGDQSLSLMNTLSSLIYKTPSLLTTKSSNNPSLGSKFLYKILYASQTNDEFLQISLSRKSLSIKGSLSFLPQNYLGGKVSISSNFYFTMSHKTQQSTKGLGVNINQDTLYPLRPVAAGSFSGLTLDQSLVAWPRPYGGQARLSVFTRHML